MRNFNLLITDSYGSVEKIECDAFAIEDRFIVYEIDKIATFISHPLINKIVAEYTGPEIEAGEVPVNAVSTH